MIHHFIHDVGVPQTIMAVILIVIGTRGLVSWWRAERNMDRLRREYLERHPDERPREIW